MKKEINKKTKELLFYIALLAFPLVQFFLMYVCVNANSFVLAFKRYDGNSSTFAGFENFRAILYDISHDPEISMALKDSLIAYVVNLLIGITLALIFSYYIFKKGLGSNFFRVLLFAPSVISPLVLVTIFKYFVDSYVPGLLREWSVLDIIGFISESEYVFPTILFYNVFIGFGTSVLMYSNAMSGINDSVIEAAQLDGVNEFSEFLYIVFPQIFSTVSVFLTTGIASIFNNQLNLFSFFKEGSDYVSTIGYYMYKEISRAGGDYAVYPKLAALGLLTTLIIAPIVLIARKLFAKMDPMEEHNGK